MTDNTMREGKLWAFLHDSIHEAYKKLSTTGTSNEYHALLDSIASKVADDVDARFLQVAQSVPVLGPPVMQALRAQIRNCPEPMVLHEAGHFVQEHGQALAQHR